MDTNAATATAAIRHYAPKSASPESYDSKAPPVLTSSDPAKLLTPAASNPKPLALDTTPGSEAGAEAFHSVAELEQGIEQAERAAAIVPRGYDGKRQKMGGVYHSDQLASRSSPNSRSKSPSRRGKSVKARTSIREIFWCDVCRVECSNAAALEFHKNGKHHKKIVRNLEVIQTRQKLLAEFEANCAKGTSSATVNQLETANESQAQAIKQPEVVVKGADEHLATVAGDSSDKVSLLAHGTLLESETQKMDGQGISSHASKRKTAVGCDGKRLRMSREYEERSHTKKHAVTCTICNVTCDTRAVFECHLVGRKHMQRAKQSHGGEAMHGPLGYLSQSDLQVSTSTGMPPPFSGFQSHVKEHSVICTICNVTCDTRAVFECHLVGKKHMQRAKQSHGGGAMHEPLGYFSQPDLQVNTSNGIPPLSSAFQSHVKEHSVICTICNVTCDTRAVFECHLVGKKHRHRLNQFPGGEAMHGPLGYFFQPYQQRSTSDGVPSLSYGFQFIINPQVPEGHCPSMSGNYTYSDGRIPIPARLQGELTQEV